MAVTNESTSGATPACTLCSRLGFVVTRLAVPAWITAGALAKLLENDPRNLPKPIFDLVLSLDGTFGLQGVAWMDFALRSICGTEFVIAAMILCMPRVARPLALAVLTLFCVILLWLIGTGWAKDGFEAVLKGSCGCFGKSGMNPLYMLMIDGALLGGVLRARKACGCSTRSCIAGGGPAAIVAAVGIAVAFGMPAPPVQLEDPTANTPTPPDVTPTVPPTAWPARPSQVQPYYLPDFATWVGKPLASQPEMALLDAPPPATISSGTWIVMLYRADCEHCHEVLEAHFVGSLKRPALLIGIPDHDPANEQPMPCTECTIRTFLKGPNYVVQTPVVMRMKDGVVEAVCTDPEDDGSLAEVLEGGS
ncbi:MAG: hypothetical protein FJ270_05940 [Planctomycetes bacterium]|nr:hypothetical protein [Planctomycetota bacterium]